MALRSGSGAAFSVERDGEERLVLVYELERGAVAAARKGGFEEIAAAVRAAVAEEHEALVTDLVLVKPGGVPKTSSGKVQRHACRDAYLDGTLAVVARSDAPAGSETDAETDPATLLDRAGLASLPPAERAAALETVLRSLAARALGCPAERLDRARPLAAHGLDSLAALDLRAAVEERLGAVLPLATLFEGATLGDLATLLAAELEADRPRLDEEEWVSAPTAAETSGTSEFPLSYGQEGLWALDRLAPGASVYNVAAAFRVESPKEGLDPERLRAALQAVTDRHPALRLRMSDVDGEPRQLAAEPGSGDAFDLAVAMAGEWTAEEVRAYLAAEAWRPFDLERGPLVRARLLRGAPAGPAEPAGDIALFAFHHTVVDFGSVGTIARTIAELWGGAAVPLPPAAGAGTYEEFVRWQRRRLTGPEGERLRAFWRERLSGLPDLDLPTDHPRPPVPGFRGLAAGAELPRRTVKRLEALAGELGTTLQAVILAGWSAWLHRVSGQDGFAVGLPTAGRSRSRFADTVGYFVNPVAVRARTEGDPGFRELLERTRDELLAALEHADDPFPRLAAELRPVRDPGRFPLFQTILVHHAGRGGEGGALAAVALGEPGARLDLGALRLLSLGLPERRALLDLTLRTALGTDGGLGLALEASADLFDRPTALRSLDQLAILLTAAASAPETALSALPLLAAAERHQLLAEWNDAAFAAAPGGEAAPGACLHELIDAQAARTPENEALVAGGVRLTYRELVGRADRLARRLAALGAEPEARVAVCLQRSADLVVALLATLKAGAAYVPLDPAYPRERLAVMLGDSAARVLITEERCLGTLPADLPPVVRMDREEPPPPALPRLPRALPGNLAYLIYTSGSTGRPKGIAIEHRSVVAFARWARTAFSAAELSGMAAVTSVCFDISIFELFAPLCWGGRTILAPSALELPTLPARGEITMVHTVPSAMAEVARSGVVFPRLRTVGLGGEAVPGELAERVHAMKGVERVVNLYGPSEDTTYSIVSNIPRGEPRPAIGWPLTGTGAYLLDRAGGIAPRGVPAELFLGGAGLARGYLDRPELTAERFVPHPFGAPGERLYRTGDIARHRPDGELDYLGRIDHQVKVRGFRVELGEIEAVLLSAHPAIKEAVVVARGPVLIAYVAPAIVGESVDLAGHLAARLPAYMVPSAFVALPALPRSPNGKVDRKALPAPRFRAAATTGTGDRPDGAVEELLGELFAEVLETESVDRDDDFFAAGGHSLSAMRLLSRIGRTFGVELPARALFEAPTVAGLAGRLRAMTVAGELPAAALPLERVARGRLLPASFAQHRIWFLDRLEPGLPTYHLPGRLALRGELDVAALAAALCRVVERHEALRTGLVERLDGPMQEIAERVDLALPTVDLAALPATLRRAEAERVAALEARRPFDLERPPLLRVLHLAFGPAEHELILTLHHLVADGWSLGLLADEVGAGYGALRQGVEPALPALVIQAADAAVWERRWFAMGHLEREIRYWTATLADEPAALDLPLDRPRPPIATSRGDRVRLDLAVDGAALDGAARRHGATPFMVLAAAWAAVLARLGGRGDLLIGTPVSVRTRPELEALIGCFVNTVPLRADLGGDPEFGELTGRLRAVCLEAYAHRHLPYERLVELLRPGREVAQAPLFQTVLLLEEPPRPPRLAGLTASLEPLATGTAKFDLTLAVERREGGLAAVLEIARDLFDTVTAERLLAAFGRLFGGALAAPETRLSELPLLATAESDQLRAWIGRQPEDRIDRGIERESPPDGGAGWEAPRGRFEVRVAELFGEALDCAGVGRHDDFFALGGHSLLASRVVFRLREELGWEVPLQALFEAPTVAGLASRVAALHGVADDVEGGPRIARIERAGPLPVSYAQERLWFLEQLAGPGALYHIAAGFEIQGSLSLAALAAALTGVVARHEGLRTRFLPEQGRPLARIAPIAIRAASAARLPVAVDLASLPLERRAEEAERVARELARCPFDLAGDLLLRAWAIRQGDDRWTFGWVVHHLVCDGASLAILEREIAEIYAAALERRAARLPELGLQPVDLAAAERNEDAERWSSQVRYWRDEMASLEPLALPTDHPRPAWGSRHRGRTWALAWRAEAVAAVASLARAMGTTPMVVALAGLAAVLARWSGAESFGLGVPVEGRWRREAEPLVGLFVNTLVVRTDVAGDPTGAELLTRLAGRLAAALAHGEVPFERLVEELAPRDTDGRAHSPWFQVMVASRPVSGRHLALPGAALVPYWIDTGTSKFDLTLFVDAEAGPDWGGAIEYDADLFEAATIERLVGWLETAWESWGERPELRLSELPLWSSAEEAELEASRRPRELRRRTAPPSVHEEPQGALEAKIAALFGAALEHSRIGRYDDFFALGGHSLLGSRVVFELRAELGWEVPFDALFEAPTVAGLAARLEAERPSAGPAGPPEPEAPIPSIPRGGALPLSFAQERLWFLEQLEGPSPLYHVAAAFKGAGRLDARVLAPALDGIWRRHEALRARFEVEAGRPVQRFAAPGQAPRLTVDLTGLPPEAAEEEAGRAVAAAVRRPFDLARGPLLRAIVIRAGTERFRLALVAHHLVADGVSLALLEQEISVRVAAVLAGRPAELPELACQYADFAAWQRSSASAELLAPEIAHWREVLAGLGPLDLPVDAPVSLSPFRHRGRTRPIAWRAEVGAAVAAWARAAGSTPFAAVLAGFAAVLSRWSGQEDFGLGVPEAGRWRHESESLVGLFVNTLVVRVDATGDPTGEELLARLGGRLADARAHGAIPFERLVEELVPERDPGRSPWFQVMVASRPASGRRLALPGVELIPAGIDSGTSKFDLTLFVDAEIPEGGWSGALEYDADRFEPATIERLMGWLERAWESWGEKPELRLSELPLGTVAEWAEIRARHRPRESRPDPTARQVLREEPQGALEMRLAELFGEALEISGVGRHDDFFALGGHSLLGSRVVFELRAELGWEVPLAALFEAPTVAGLAAWLVAAVPQETIPAIPRDGALPLSLAQERLWFLEQLEGPSPLYHIPAAFDGLGRLDPGALRAALSAVWSRHEALRARFTVEGGRPVQTFAPPGPMTIAEVDLSGVAARGAEIDAAVAEVVRRPFDLERGPLLRMVLIRVGAERFRLVLAVHHLVADGVSLEIVERELGALYRRALGLAAPALPPLALQHADVASWQRGRATEERLATWIAELGAGLGAAIEPLELPVDRPRPAVSRHRGESREIAPWLDGTAFVPAVSRLAEQCGATAYQVFFAAFGALVGRLARRDSLTIGFPVSGRTADAKDLVGLFADTRVVRVDLEGDPTAVELIAGARAGLRAAETQGDVPFERLVEVLAPARSRSFSPLYQVSLVARPSSERRLDLPGLDLQPLALSTATAKRDLTLFVDPQAAMAASGVVEYDADLFDAATIQRWMGQLGRLLADMAARPEAPLSELRLLSEAERHQLIAEWNRPLPGPLEAMLLEELVDPWEMATPDALAVADPSSSLTYAELGARANRLAWRLRDLGVGEESLVAICLDRSVDLVVAELAALRAGGAYAPIDPAYPEQRRADMVAIARARVVVTLSHLAGDWCGGATVIALDRIAAEDDLRPGRPPCRRDPDRLAYAMFTSGSTGRPKGVGMSHRGALHIVTWHRRRYGWTSADRGAQISGPSFDAAVNEIWPALGVGASIHVPVPEIRLSPPALLAWFAGEGVTVTWTPTPIAEALLAEPEPPGLVLRFLQTGGDRLHRRAPAGSTYLLNNHYGPVENAVLTTEIDVPAADPGIGPSSLPTIGRPLAGTRVYVLDRSLALAPWGAAGELVAGGRGVARGYLGDPAQTAERFVPDPYSGEAGSRMYRTGDLVRFRRDGEIDFLGRLDKQVKIRGQRVELGEVEVALTALPGVREAAVLAREDGPGGAGDRRLVAYVVLEPGVELADGDLVEPLRRRLTDAMVPRAFVRLDRLPATTNGKVDRRALAALAPEAQAGAGRMPRTEAEALVAAVWAELLGLERVGVEDDFFSLGGHSLLATRVTHRLQQELGVAVPVALLYEAPTVAGLVARLEALRGSAALAPAEPIPILPRCGALPLSFAQERLWFLEQLEGPSPLYHIPAAFESVGQLDFAALQAAVSAVWSRHEALRARFTVEGGRPVQTFAPPGPLAIAEVDLSGVATRTAELDAVVDEVVRRPFDLERGPLLRVVLIRGGAERFRLVLAVHHLVADGVSLRIVERELGALYRGALGLEAPAPPPLALQHADVASWQRGRATEERLARWIAELGAGLGAAIEPLELPVDRPRPAVSSHRGESRAIAPWLDGTALVSAVSHLAEQCGATAYQVFFAAFGVLVGRLARRDSLTLGFPVSGRTADAENLVGLFADTRVVRFDLAGDPAAVELIAGARAGLRAAETRGDVPLERLVEALAPARNRSFSPLYQVSVVARPSSERGERRLELLGLELRPLALSTATAKRDLTLFVDPQAATAASGVIEYDADLFDTATIQRWMGQLGRLMADMAARPGARLSELRLLSEAERHQLIAEWNRPLPGPLGAMLLEELVDPWEMATPDALAVADPSSSLTYAELGARANRLAWRLRDLGVGEESLVAICLDRSVDLVVAELAALRAGGAYAPIDPAYPEQRRADMVAIARARVVVTLSHLTGEWCGGATVIALDRIAAEEDLRPGRPPYRRNPDRLAYAMFTSGSTGRPKGVGMSHRGALHIVTWHRRRYGWTSADRGAQISGPSFDAAVNEIWPALGMGASIHVPPPEVRLSPPELLEWFARKGVTVTWTPTPIAEALLAEPEPPGLVLRFLQTGGDRLHRRAPAGSTYLLNNHYGPVENAVLTTEIDVPAADPGIGPSSLPTIGRPLAGTRVYVLDRSLALAPWGAAGELVAGGRGVARGYLGDPAQTAERFVPDPYSGEAGSRMYRTGDLVRFRRDGEIDFLGRLDKQVKIRGQRVELGEVEVALTALPGVREAAVLAREDGPGGLGDRRLVAYVVLEPGVELSDRDLVESLRRRLTDAMVPRAFVRLDRLPATTNGKVDRRALAALAPEAQAGRMPRTEAEARVAAVWAELLGLERVGVEDDFFSLGGHSLLATRLTYRLQRELGVPVPVALLYEAPTVAGLVARLEEPRESSAAAEPVAPAPRNGALPMSFAQERLWFLEQLEGPSPLYHIAAVVEGAGGLDTGALRLALSAVWSRHEALRACFRAEDGRPLQTFAEPGPLALSVVDFSGTSSPRAIDEAAAEAVRQPFDLERGPLLRAVLLRLGPERFQLALVVHHLVADGVSLTILERELGVFYRGALGLPVTPPPPLALQHADFALWQRGRLERSGGDLRDKIAAAKAELASATEPLGLPSDRPRGASPRRRGAVLPLSFWIDGAEVAEAVPALSRRLGATAFQIWFAAFAALLGRLTGRESLAIGVPVAGRSAASQDLVGLFADTLVVPADLGGDPSGEEMIGRVRARRLTAETQAEVPFEKLVEAIAPARDRAVAPLFQVALTARPGGVRGLDLPGVELVPLPVRTGTAKFDLTLSIDPQPSAEVRGAIEFDADLFDLTTIQRWIGSLGRLLAGMAQDPGRALSALPLLSAAERFQLLTEWNATAVPFPRLSIPEVFAEQAERTPEALAVLGDTPFTYAELERRANRLARHLGRLGVGLEVPGGTVRRAQARADRGDPRGAQGGGGLRASRPRAAAGAFGLDDRGRGRAHDRRLGPSVAPPGSGGAGGAGRR